MKKLDDWWPLAVVLLFLALVIFLMTRVSTI